MNYELKFDDNGKFDGFQLIRWELSDKRFAFTEYQFFMNGEYQNGFVVIIDRKVMKTFVARSEDWGTMENARDAAERFGMGSIKTILRPSLAGLSSFVLPFTEEAFV